MDRDELKKRLHKFEELGYAGNLKFRIARLDEDDSGFGNGTYIVRIFAPWSVGKSFDEIMDPLLELLWQTTDPETRGAISSLRVSPHEADTEVFAKSEGLHS
ncbi:hypothetical protein [Hymenobacter terricola]|uniref:hypothetical protein n=1 Tax=Hymenobacter terricola TaxID=2819236 RepID=UPI001B312A5F|nr:hypothetical protein [Hymenobacter terricola]